jgi:hypothetical protein
MPTIQIDFWIYIFLVLGFIFSIILDRYILKNEKIFLTTPVGLLMSMGLLYLFISGAARSKHIYAHLWGYITVSILLSMLYGIQFSIYYLSSKNSKEGLI